MFKKIGEFPTLKFNAGAIAGMALAVYGSLAGGQTEPAKPNVIMIFTDDMGYGDISSFRQYLDIPVTDTYNVDTPNIDELATEGMSFTQFYVAMPICSPSRAAVLSGRFSPETRITTYLQAREGNNTADQNDWMDPALSYFPKSFQAAGYATGHVGKWHLGGGRDVDNAPSISEYGYDEYYSTWESPNPDPVLGVEFPPWNRSLAPGQIVRHRRTEYMVNKTLEFLDRHPDDPCFVTLWPDDLHTPFWPAGGDSGNNTKADFYKVLEEYDRQIGRLLDGLDTRGLTDNTIVFFTGDNGPNPAYAGRFRTDGLRGKKSQLYEGGIRQPFIIRWPGHIPADTVNSTILGAVDLLPTITSLAGVDMLPEGAADTNGIDLSNAMLHNVTMQRSKLLMWEFGPNTSNPHLAIREGDFKLLVRKNGDDLEYYNLSNDPDESTNLAGQAQYADEIQALKNQVIAWSQSLPHRTHAYPAFATVDFNQSGIAELVSAAQLNLAAGAPGQIVGIAADSHDDGDIFIIHESDGGKETFLRYDYTTGEIDKITDSDKIAADLGVFGEAPNLNPVGGFDYSSPGDRLYFADTALGINGQVALIAIEVGTGHAHLVTRSTDLAGISDLSVLLHGNIAAVRGDQGGNNTMGTVQYETGDWTQRATEANFVAAAPGTSDLSPVVIGTNDSNGEAFVFAEGDGELFEVFNPDSATPTISRQGQAALASADLRDISVDQAGNMYALDESGQRVVLLSASGAVAFVDYAQIQMQMGSTITPVPKRGIDARMLGNRNADLFLATATSDAAVVRVRFGVPRADVHNWTLY